MIALVTANFGGIDEMKPIPRVAGIDTFYYTDGPTVAKTNPRVSRTWTKTMVPRYPRHDFDARLRARYFKHQIHRLDETQSYDWLAWSDSSLYFFETDFILDQVDRLKSLAPDQQMLAIPHPQRNTAQEEGEFVLDQMAQNNPYLVNRYKKEKIDLQMKWLRNNGYDLSAAPLFAGGFWIVANNKFFADLWNDWWDQNLRFGMMDQISLAALLDARGVRPQRLEVELFHNQHFAFVAHP